MGRPFLESHGYHRGPLGIFAAQLPAKAITWHIRNGATQYGIGTYGSSFADYGQELSFGKRIPSVDEIDAALFLARHRIDHGAWSGPIQINGTDKYKGAVLARAVALDIPLGNPELATLQDILRRQANLTPTNERINTLYGTAAHTAPQTAAATTTQSDVHTPHDRPDEPNDPSLHENSPVIPVVPAAAASVTRTPLIADVERLLAIDFDASEIQLAAGPPKSHLPNEVQTYVVLAGDAQQIALSFGDGSYLIVPRTEATRDVQPESLVMVRTNKDGQITAIAPYTERTHITLPRAKTGDDPDVVFRNAAPPEISGFTAEIGMSMLDGDARAALAAENVAPSRMKNVPFTMPVKNTTLTVLARNDAGFALRINSFGHYSLVDHGKIPLPDVEAGQKIAFRSVDGAMLAMDTVAAKRIDAAKGPAHVVST